MSREFADDLFTFTQGGDNSEFKKRLAGATKINIHDNSVFYKRLERNQRLRIKQWLEHNSQEGTLNIVCCAHGEPIRIWRNQGCLVFQETVAAVLLALNIVGTRAAMIQIFSDDLTTMGQIITAKRKGNVPNVKQYFWEPRNEKETGFGKTVLQGFVFEKTPEQPVAFVAHVDEPASE